MNEQFLHFVWKNRLFENNSLQTVGNLAIDIIEPGIYNRDSGPDFINARIVIAGIEWAGNVEIHLKSSMWDDHKHNIDHAYNNVILHVVCCYDRDVYTASGSSIDTLVIEVDNSILNRYNSYMLDPSVIACRDDIYKIDRYFIKHWLNSLAVSRLDRKTESIQVVLDQTGGSWEETLYLLIAGNFGLNINRDPFHRLASKVPLKLIQKHADNRFQVEALLYGQAGMLSEDLFSGSRGDNYHSLLLREYTILKSKYSLEPLEAWQWKFHRMRPANFPTIRISQLAGLMIRSNGLFSRIKESDSIDVISNLLYSESSEYWHHHYQFGKKADRLSIKTGATLINSIIINSVIPLLFLYGTEHSQNIYSNKAVEWYDSIKSESNRVTREWSKIGVETHSSFESQGLIELTDKYCKNRECLNCHIGSKLISLGREFKPDNNLSLGEPDYNKKDGQHI